MGNRIYAIKGSMTESYLGDSRVAVTKLKVPSHVVSQIKNDKKDGYNALQIALGSSKKRSTKAQQGHLKQTKKVPLFIREAQIEGEFKVGDEIPMDKLIKKGDIVSVQGKTKGKGFTGTIKRWGFARQPKTHGQSDRTRAPGSIGLGTTPGRVFKGKKMSGRMGSNLHTVKNAQVLEVDLENNEILITGSVPGNEGGLIALTITDFKEIKESKEQPPVEVNEETEKKENKKEEAKEDKDSKPEEKKESEEPKKEEVDAPEEEKKDEEVKAEDKKDDKGKEDKEEEKKGENKEEEK